MTVIIICVFMQIRIISHFCFACEVKNTTLDIQEFDIGWVY